MIEKILIVICALVLVAVNMYALIGYINLPIVYEDVGTGKCVKVEYANGKLGDCKNLPEKYNHEYSYGK